MSSYTVEMPGLEVSEDHRSLMCLCLTIITQCVYSAFVVNLAGNVPQLTVKGTL